MRHASRHFMALAALAAGAALAQTTTHPDPADPRARAPAPVYHSAFDGYRGVESAQRPAWREANEEAARIGGHIGILREQAVRDKAPRGDRK